MPVPTFISPALPVSTRASFRPRSGAIPASRNARVVRPCANAAATARNHAARAAAAAAAAAILLSPMPALHAPDAGLHASGSAAHAARNSNSTFTSASGFVNKDGESLLRWSLPLSNKPVREVQAALESIIANVKGLQWAKMDQGLQRATMLLNRSSDDILKSVPSAGRDAAAAQLAHAVEDLPGINDALTDRNTDKLIARTRDVLRDLGRVEEAMVNDFPFEVPDEYANLPQLRGRATVEVVVRQADGEQFDIEGTLYKEGRMTLVLDGYSAPVNAGAFVDLVDRGFYDGLPVIRSDGFIIQTGKPADGDGFVDKASGELRTIPLEVFAKGDRSPVYGLTLEDDGRGGSGTVLPFSSYGTLAMARQEFEPNTASSQFFWFLFEPDLTPAGRNLLDGSWSVFGYTVEGEKFLKGLQKGDKIVSAKVVSGLENLQRPTAKS